MMIPDSPFIRYTKVSCLAYDDTVDGVKALSRMQTMQAIEQLETERYMELNREHLASFLEQIEADVALDSRQVEDLIRGTVCQGGNHGKGGVPCDRGARR